jgi:hypothetical protein
MPTGRLTRHVFLRHYRPALLRTQHSVGRWVTWARSSVRAQVIRRTALTLTRVPKPRAYSSEGRLRWTEATLTHDVRRRPTLPRGPPRSTIGAEELNFRVRNGTGCFPFAMTAETLWRFRSSAFPGGLPATRPTAPREPHSGRERTTWELPPRRKRYEPSLSAY